MSRAVLTVQALYARCIEDPVTGCWHWRGGMGTGRPSLWTLDYGRVEKRTMQGTLAVWHIAHHAPPPAGRIVYRACCVFDCMKPAHLALARDRKEIGAAIRRAGSLVGKSRDAKLASLTKARAAAGIESTPAEIVRCIRATDPSVTTTALARQHGMAISAVSSIRLGRSRQDVVA